MADEVNEVLGGLSPNDLPDIESDDETEEGAAAAAEGIAGVGLKSHDTEDDSDDDDDDDDDDEYLQDDREEGGGKIRSRAGSASMRPRAGSSGKKERHFWQYNVQAKGPKGQKIVVSTRIEDPHVLNDIVDPVFSGAVQLQGIKHRYDNRGVLSDSAQV